MIASRTTQFVVGIVAIIAGCATGYFAIRLGGPAIIPPARYVIHADFGNIAGLKVGDEIQIAGVTIGRVRNITLKGGRAHVAMSIDETVKIDDEATAAVSAVGIVGGRCISIAPDSGKHFLSDGDVLRKTRPALILEDVIDRLLSRFGSGAGNREEKK